MSWSIVAHSFSLLFRNLPQALRISVGPYLIGAAICILIATLVGVPFLQIVQGGASPVAMQQLGGGFILAVFLCLLIMLFVSGWVAVAWHRYVLLEEEPGILPAITGKPIWPYVGRTLLLAIVLILIAIPLSIVLGLIAAPLIGDGRGGSSMFFAMVFGIVIGAILGWFWLRLALILPATAVERVLTMGDSWRQTAKIAGAIFGAILILIGLNSIVSYVFLVVLGPGTISAILQLIVNWISLMVGISILTTLYGIAIEGRDIPR